MMKANVKWVGDRTFVGTAGSGHAIAFGAAHGESGVKPGPSPMELLLLGTGGCSAYDVVHILERGREPVEDVEVQIEAERADTDPKVYKTIHMHFIIKGRGLNPAKAERAVSLSIEKYCSASAMMAATATLTHDFEIIETA
ncbi:OsmC family protein [Alisedimentitalea sp. MJ-SS2]|uniref:OsmC family protein n=1 Tax=Aliisedimentitalea sp. MJ-SS2 TaxID=3049795 RepID=UPI0029147016|nr:OsmC family protein [Alisedimentitalea sp. MJ-SS2]MDU8925794.1 OsmC family protein [Alisedimentitalea sp. MJ-SS2]